jgi:hypothetical protein
MNRQPFEKRPWRKFSVRCLLFSVIGVTLIVCAEQGEESFALFVTVSLSLSFLVGYAWGSDRGYESTPKRLRGAGFGDALRTSLGLGVSASVLFVLRTCHLGKLPIWTGADTALIPIALLVYGFAGFAGGTILAALAWGLQCAFKSIQDRKSVWLGVNNGNLWNHTESSAIALTQTFRFATKCPLLTETEHPRKVVWWQLLRTLSGGRMLGWM